MSIKVVRDPANAKVDIVLVHGWHGDQAPWTSVEKSVFWPEKLLAAKTPEARILSFEYDVTIDSFWSEEDGITDFSNDLIYELMDQRTEKEKEARPIIFVAHCLGGLVCENALVRAAEHPQRKELVNQVQGIIFLGTPHFSSNTLSAATKYFQLAHTPDEEIPKDSDLQDKSRKLISIPPAFANLRESGAQIEVECFYEGSATKLNDKNVKIVDETLAQCPTAPPPERLARSHQQLSQFESEDDKDYRKVLRVLTQWVAKIAPPEKEELVKNVSNATFSGSHNSGLQLGQNAGVLSGFRF